MAENFKIRRAEYIEVPIGATNTKQQVYFPDLPNLRNARVYGIEAYSSDTQNPTMSGATSQDRAQLLEATLSLYFSGGDFIQVPLLSIYRGNSTTFRAEIPELAGQTIVWAKSYVYLNDAAGIANYQSKSFVFNVYYTLSN